MSSFRVNTASQDRSDSNSETNNNNNNNNNNNTTNSAKKSPFSVDDVTSERRFSQLVSPDRVEKSFTLQSESSGDRGRTPLRERSISSGDIPPVSPLGLPSTAERLLQRGLERRASRTLSQIDMEAADSTPPSAVATPRRSPRSRHVSLFTSSVPHTPRESRDDLIAAGEQRSMSPFNYGTTIDLSDPEKVERLQRIDRSVVGDKELKERNQIKREEADAIRQLLASHVFFLQEHPSVSHSRRTSYAATPRRLSEEGTPDRKKKNDSIPSDDEEGSSSRGKQAPVENPLDGLSYYRPVPVGLSPPRPTDKEDSLPGLHGKPKDRRSPGEEEEEIPHDLERTVAGRGISLDPLGATHAAVEEDGPSDDDTCQEVPSPPTDLEEGTATTPTDGQTGKGNGQIRIVSHYQNTVYHADNIRDAFPNLTYLPFSTRQPYEERQLDNNNSLHVLTTVLEETSFVRYLLWRNNPLLQLLGELLLLPFHYVQADTKLGVVCKILWLGVHFVLSCVLVAVLLLCYDCHRWNQIEMESTTTEGW
ncbi:hypothetical protein ADEAN_000131100 [Angomonas deanei]|uniref:Uncharacterized protein n=1 Tax=Angomonas deanei TaxID=59799 RepID=A0A7G2C246_9TRYP|nr:hypothetical protein ADEAN_000131100 [Angomonas deanei]